MKLVLSLILLFFTLTQEKAFDRVEVSNVLVKNKFGKSYNLDSPNKLTKTFGQARARKIKEEVLDGDSYIYAYKGFETYFNQKNWEASTISGSEYSLSLNNVIYKIGDPIVKLQKQFPLSYKNREKRSKNDNGLWIKLSQNLTLIDANVFIKYNDKGYITEMSIANDNS